MDDLNRQPPVLNYRTPRNVFERITYAICDPPGSGLIALVSSVLAVGVEWSCVWIAASGPGVLVLFGSLLILQLLAIAAAVATFAYATEALVRGPTRQRCWSIAALVILAASILPLLRLGSSMH